MDGQELSEVFQSTHSDFFPCYGDPFNNKEIESLQLAPFLSIEEKGDLQGDQKLTCDTFLSCRGCGYGTPLFDPEEILFSFWGKSPPTRGIGLDCRVVS